MTTANVRSWEPKDPQEVDYWNIDFSELMPASDSITAIVTVFVDAERSTDDALLIDEFANTTKVVSGRWREGTREASYMITARVTTAQGRTLDKSGCVLVIDL